jgi:hypothetical protein
MEAVESLQNICFEFTTKSRVVNGEKDQCKIEGRTVLKVETVSPKGETAS